MRLSKSGWGSSKSTKSKTWKERAIFYDPESLSAADVEVIQSYAEHHDLEAMSVRAFRARVFLKYGYTRCGSIVGFNLPFDISRLAIGHGPARGHMRGGFSFKLTPDKRDPNVRVKHLNARAALIDFAAPGKAELSRGERKRGIKIKPHRGFFLDLKTFAAALTSQSFSLKRLTAFLGVPTQKLETDEHGGPLTPEYLDYARADVQASWECFLRLKQRYAEHGLETESHRILSEASIGKAYLKQMGVEPLLGYQENIDRAIFGIIMASYYGGRAEVRIRRMIRQVLYCDFKSMYPTVSALMGLWPYVIGSELTEPGRKRSPMCGNMWRCITTRDGCIRRSGTWTDTTQDTQDTQGLLDRIQIIDLQKPKTWQLLKTLVRVRPDQHTVPVRAKYDEKVNTIGLNVLSSQEPLWYTLADCIASKLLSGKTPIIEEAITFKPGPPQKGLDPVDLFGHSGYSVDPRKHDVFNWLIDRRDKAKANGDPNEKAIKIIANATSYGIFIEIQRDDAPKSEPLNVYDPCGECQPISIQSH